jgi:hypothetical protein
MIMSLFEYEILPFVDNNLYCKLLLTNKEIHDCCLIGITNLEPIKVNIWGDSKKMKLWGKRNFSSQLQLYLNLYLNDMILQCDPVLDELYKCGYINTSTKLYNLKVLDTCNKSLITDLLESCSELYNLKVLDIYKSSIINDFLKSCPNLEELIMGTCSYNLNNECLKYIPNLRYLHLKGYGNHPIIDDHGLNYCRNLEKLIVHNYSGFTPNGLSKLPKLKVLIYGSDLEKTMDIINNLEHFPNLEELHIYDFMMDIPTESINKVKKLDIKLVIIPD